MSTRSKDGGPAFPIVAADGEYLREDGMTLRDWFAGMALQGILSNAWVTERFGAPPSQRAKDAYEFADAMLRASEQKEVQP